MRNSEKNNTSRYISEIDWSDDLPVFKSDSAKEIISQFGDDLWSLKEFQWKVTAVYTNINFGGFPEVWKNTAKRIAWCMLNIKAPVELMQRPNAMRTRLSTGSVISHVGAEIKPFLNWLDENKIHKLSEVTKDSLTQYGEYISVSPISRNYKSRMLWGPTRFWLYSKWLPEADQLVQPPWEVEGTTDILGPANWSAENQTYPLHPETMSPLLTWALTLTQDMSKDILTAIEVRDEMKNRHRMKIKVGDNKKVNQFLEKFLLEWKGLPSTINRKNGLKGSAAIAYISSSADVGRNATRGLIDRKFKDLNLDLVGSPLYGVPPLMVHGQAIRPFVDYYEVDELKRLLMTACFIVVAYLSGMRGEECRGLERNSCKRIPVNGDASRYEIWAKSYKDALDHDGNTIPGGKIRDEPWHIIEPAARAIQVMEALHDSQYLFSANAFQLLSKNGKDYAISAQSFGYRIQNFVRWCNEQSLRLGLTELVIADDPNGAITLARFRRTLAWFIYRRPAGRISLGIQYGHLQGSTSDGYGSRVSTGLRDLFPMEEALARAEKLTDASDRLSAGEGVSGPATLNYMRGVEEFSQRYQGKYLNTKQLAEMQRDPIFKIYDNGMQPLACCYDPTKALCHIRRDKSPKTETTPNLLRCNSRCPNIAMTDSHRIALYSELKFELSQANSKMVPEPMRLRHQQRVDTLKAIIKKHDDEKQIIVEVS